MTTEQARLTDAERDSLDAWIRDGSYYCGGHSWKCTPACEPTHEYLTDVVERIIAERVAQARTKAVNDFTVRVYAAAERLKAQWVAQAKAEAWDEGYGACVAKNRLVGRVGTASNPYRPCEDRYCTDCPDHEACSSGYPCMVTKASHIRPAAPSEGGE